MATYDVDGAQARLSELVGRSLEGEKGVTNRLIRNISVMLQIMDQRRSPSGSSMPLK